MENKPIYSRINIISIFAIIFSCHFVVFLAFYPGICSYDLNAQMKQYVSHDFCTNHPLLHTLFIGFFHNLFASEQYGYDYNKGYAIATIIQLLIVIGAMTYSVSYILSASKIKSPAVCAVLFYALFPINSLLAISHTKDILFAAFGLIFFIDSLRLLKSNSDSRNQISIFLKQNSAFFIRMVLNSVLMILMRNNAVHSAVLTILFIFVLIIFNRKATFAKKYVIAFVIALVLAMTVNRALIISTNASPGSIKEMMSVPAQIMGRIYNTVASEDEKATILQYIPNVEEYKYYISDPMKLNLPFEIWESKCKHFLLDSAIIALHHPIISIQAFWYNIQGYIDPFHMPYSSDHFFLARYDYRGNATLESKIKWLCDLYVTLFRKTDSYSHNPIVIPFNLGIYIWIDAIAFAFLIHKYRKCSHNHNFMAYIFPMFYFLTLLLGPAAIIRYGYLYILIAPIAFVHIFASKSE